jgi:hypothetical protein
MDTNVRTPIEIFTLPQLLVVPLFQRPYVWNLEDQWAPLWQDVRRIAELRLSGSSRATHFLGAVVVQASDNAMGALQSRQIIDGQQRLTTLQLLIDASAAVFDDADIEMFPSQLETLTHNASQFATKEVSRLKLQHSNRDRDAFVEVMSAESPIDYGSLKHSASLLARAHAFFAQEVGDWLGADEGSAGARAAALTSVLTSGLEIVVIDLHASEDSQEIFETLNARGTPLSAADLIKNFVFQRLSAEGANTDDAYRNDWPFDEKFWETEVSVGRYLVSRSSLFLNQWLVSRLGEEISPKSTFTRFKHFIEHETSASMAEMLRLIRTQADTYREWTLAADDPRRRLSPVEMCVYRMQASGVELLKPVLIWLHDPELDIPTGTSNKVIAAMESWMVRRQLLRLQSADHGRVVAEIIRANRDAPAAELPDRVTGYLSRLSVQSTYWPGDDETVRALSVESAYRRFPRARLRMYLEAIEDALRSTYKSEQVIRREHPIEHLLPQSWGRNWPVEGLAAEIERKEHVHRLGNLTLLTESMNSSVSNSAWLGDGGKREKIRGHDLLLLNRRILEVSAEGWDETHIDTRTAELVRILLRVWPVPEGHTGEVLDPRAQDTSWIELRHVVAAGLLEPGTILRARSGRWADATATVLPGGQLEVDGQAFGSPSAAAMRVRGGATNGWHFWSVPDGRRLGELRVDVPSRSVPRSEPVAATSMEELTD